MSMPPACNNHRRLISSGIYHNSRRVPRVSLKATAHSRYAPAAGAQITLQKPGKKRQTSRLCGYCRERKVRNNAFRLWILRERTVPAKWRGLLHKARLLLSHDKLTVAVIASAKAICALSIIATPTNSRP